jgi:hypothetical protein
MQHDERDEHSRKGQTEIVRAAAVRLTAVSNATAQAGPTIAPQLSIIRSKPKTRP